MRSKPGSEIEAQIEKASNVTVRQWTSFFYNEMLNYKE